jgi:hypothetical protein
MGRIIAVVALGTVGTLMLWLGIGAASGDRRTDFQKRLDRASCDELFSDLGDSRAAAAFGNPGAQGRADAIHEAMVKDGC